MCGSTLHMLRGMHLWAKDQVTRGWCMGWLLGWLQQCGRIKGSHFLLEGELGLDASWISY